MCPPASVSVRVEETPLSHAPLLILKTVELPEGSEIFISFVAVSILVEVAAASTTCAERYQSTLRVPLPETFGKPVPVSWVFKTVSAEVVAFRFAILDS